MTKKRKPAKKAKAATDWALLPGCQPTCDLQAQLDKAAKEIAGWSPEQRSQIVGLCPTYEEVDDHDCNAFTPEPTDEQYREEVAARDALKELRAATALFGNFASVHEAYGVLMEEVAELFDEIRKKDDQRDYHNMRHEAIQIAAMALKICTGICDPRIEVSGPAPDPT
jgi:hypothetical protein